MHNRCSDPSVPIHHRLQGNLAPLCSFQSRESVRIFQAVTRWLNPTASFRIRKLLLMAWVGSDVRQDGQLFLGFFRRKVKSLIKRFRSEAEGVLER